MIETMRREGYEFQVSTPRVLYKEIDGVKCEPIERLLIDVPEDSVGAIMMKIGSRKGELLHMTPHSGRMRLEFLVPARGLFGYRSEFMTDTRGEGIMNTVFHDYEPYKGTCKREIQVLWWLLKREKRLLMALIMRRKEESCLLDLERRSTRA